jgi:predicted Zn-dependent protease with MMP-like domain
MLQNSACACEAVPCGNTLPQNETGESFQEKYSRKEVALLNSRTRERFDVQLEKVLSRLPPLIHELIEKVPLHVEDYPSDEVMDRLGVEYIDDLCGLYTGIPIGEKSIMHSGTLPDVVTIYREGILSAAADEHRRIQPKTLREQIRITILHELAHHHGLTEEDLRKLGYG